MMLPFPMSFTPNWPPKISTRWPKRMGPASLASALVAALAICPTVLAEQAELGSAMRDTHMAPAPASTAYRTTRLVAEPGLRIALPPEARPLPRSAPGGPLRIGFHRLLPAGFQGELAGRLEWTDLADGSVAGSLAVASPGAAAIRVALSARLPPKGEIRFFNPDEPRGGVFRVTVPGDFHTRSDGTLEPLWSPVVEGEAIGVEVTLPSRSALAAFSLRVDKVSHRPQGTVATAAQSSQCTGQVDVQCRVGLFPAGVQDAVVRIVFEAEDGPSVCTATLLNNQLQDFTPYLLTANHCISTPAVARTLEASWFYERPACGSTAAPVGRVDTTGSTQLVTTARDQDATLLRLLGHRVPLDAVYSGWNPNPLTHPTDVYGIHHPQGDYKKYSAGETKGHEAFDDVVNSIAVEWYDGVTEGGSSGSGLFAGGHLVGILSGGDEECGTSDWYGNFSDFYPKACPWLNPDGVCVGRDMPLFLSASNPVRQGFARIVNRSDWAGEVRITGIDDAGARFGPVTLELGAGRTVHFNSEDLERGNPGKGLAQGLGIGQGDWRLEFDSDLDIEALAYVRTADGFVTTMHDVAPSFATEASVGYFVPFFNPGSNTRQVSKLRLVNPTDRTATVEIQGRDDSGFTPRAVALSLPAGTARTITAHQLERGEGLSGRLGDGVGKWSLIVASDTPIQVMNLLDAPTGNLANLSSPNLGSDLARSGILPLFLAAGNSQRQGFARVRNQTSVPGTVTIHAIDEHGRVFGPVELRLAPLQTAHFNSTDLEQGNPDKGLVGRIGTSSGDWALALTTNLESVLAWAYVRTTDGFVTGMDDVVRYADGQYAVPTFNPGSNRNQESSLRLINLGESDAALTITAIDDAGRRSGDVRLTLGEDRSRTLTARELELGTSGIAGRLGDGAGKWRLTVRADQPVAVMSLLLSPTGNLANLSTTTAP